MTTKTKIFLGVLLLAAIIVSLVLAYKNGKKSGAKTVKAPPGIAVTVPDSSKTTVTDQTKEELPLTPTEEVK